MLKKIGSMAYKLELLASSWFHPIFHVSGLKKIIGDEIPIQLVLLEIDEEGKVILELEIFSKIRSKKLRSWVITKYLIKLKKLLVEDSTWEYESFIQKPTNQALRTTLS